VQELSISFITPPRVSGMSGKCFQLHSTRQTIVECDDIGLNIIFQFSEDFVKPLLSSKHLWKYGYHGYLLIYRRDSIASRNSLTNEMECIVK
jgi:hypothetical protein